VHHLLQLADGLHDAPGDPPATQQGRDQGAPHQQQGAQQGRAVVGLLLGNLSLGQLIDVDGHGIDLLDERLPQIAKVQAGLLIGGGIATALVLGGQQGQHAAAGMAEVGLQGGRDLTVVLLGTGDNQSGQDGANLLFGGGELGRQLGEEGLIVEAVDGVGAQPVGGVDQGRNVVLVAGDAGGGFIHVLNGTVDFLFADHGHQQHQQAGEQERDKHLKTNGQIIQ